MRKRIGKRIGASASEDTPEKKRKRQLQIKRIERALLPDEVRKIYGYDNSGKITNKVVKR